MKTATRVTKGTPPRNSYSSEPAKGTPARPTPVNNGTDRIENRRGPELSREEKGTGC